MRLSILKFTKNYNINKLCIWIIAFGVFLLGGPGLAQADVTFGLMVTTVTTGGQARVTGGEVNIVTEGGGTQTSYIDPNGCVWFTIPSTATSRATFSGQFVAYTLRFEFSDGLMTVYNDALAADQQEAVLPYYLNVDGTYVVEYKQEYLYMLAPADPGAFIMGPLMSKRGAALALSPIIAATPPADPPNIPPTAGDPPAGYNPPASGGVDVLGGGGGGGGTSYSRTGGIFGFGPGGTSSPFNMAQSGEIPSLEIGWINPDGSLTFKEWVPIGGSGTLVNGFSWSTDLLYIFDLAYVVVTNDLSDDFVNSLASGRHLLAYRLIDSTGAGSNYRLAVFDK